MPAQPVITSIDNVEDNVLPAKVDVTFTADAGTTNKVQYRKKSSSIWLDSSVLVGPGTIQVTGLKNHIKYIFRVDSDAVLSEEVEHFVDSTDTDRYGENRAQILRPKLLNKIAKKITDVNREFETVDGFELVEIIKVPQSDSISVPAPNPFTGEVMQPALSHPVNKDNTSRKYTVFSGVLDAITMWELMQSSAGSTKQGDIIIIINSTEIDRLDLSLQRIRDAFAILIREPQFINVRGQALNIVDGAYKINEVVPVTLNNRMFDIEVTLNPQAIEFKR